jgi:hypothetical protein
VQLVQNPDVESKRPREVDYPVWCDTGGDPQAARSRVYASSHALSLSAELHRRGIIDDHGSRDVETGRKVRTIVQQVARLASAEPDEAEKSALVDTYLTLRDKPLPQVKQIIDDVQRKHG